MRKGLTEALRSRPSDSTMPPRRCSESWSDALAPTVCCLAAALPLPPAARPVLYRVGDLRRLSYRVQQAKLTCPLVLTTSRWASQSIPISACDAVSDEGWPQVGTGTGTGPSLASQRRKRRGRVHRLELIVVGGVGVKCELTMTRLCSSDSLAEAGGARPLLRPPPLIEIAASASGAQVEGGEENGLVRLSGTGPRGTW